EVLGFLGSPSTSVIRPAMFTGPIDRQRIDASVAESGVCAANGLEPTMRASAVTRAWLRRLTEGRRIDTNGEGTTHKGPAEGASLQGLWKGGGLSSRAGLGMTSSQKLLPTVRNMSRRAPACSVWRSEFNE